MPAVVETRAAHPPDEPVWGSAVVDPHSKDLPALKMSYLLEHLPERGKVLEIGCGEGKILKTIARFRPQLELHGSDVRPPQSSPDAFAFHSLQAQNALRNGTFDVVLLVDVLEHVRDPDQMLRDARRLLRPDGTLLAFIPVEGEPLSFYAAYRRLFGSDLYVTTKDHVQAFTHAGLLALVTRHFEIVDLRYAYHALGQFMDASFFAATRLSALRRFWWKENVYYNPDEKQAGLLSKALNRCLELGNWVAWLESTALTRVRAGAAGVLLCARVQA